MRPRITLLILLLALALPLLAAAHAPPRRVTITVNGRRVAEGLAVGAGGHAGDAVFVPVDAVMRAVDGASPAAPHLRLTGATLSAIAEGGCGDCALRVARPVVISSRVRAVERAPAIPLPDLVAALEGRLEADAAGGVYGIFAGKCTWCILEPR